MTANDYALIVLFYALIGVTVGIGARSQALRSDGDALPLRGFEFLAALGGIGYGLAGTTILAGVGWFAGLLLLIGAGCGHRFGRAVYEQPDKTMAGVAMAVFAAIPLLFHFALG
jgi:hypothetical protein